MVGVGNVTVAGWWCAMSYPNIATLSLSCLTAARFRRNEQHDYEPACGLPLQAHYLCFPFMRDIRVYDLGAGVLPRPQTN